MTCQTDGCGRARQTASGGTAYAYCHDCTALLLRAAFGESSDSPVSAREVPPLGARAHQAAGTRR